MRHDLFDKVNKDSKPRKDKTFYLTVLAVSLVVGLMFYSLYFFINYFDSHNDYMKELGDSFIYAENNDSFKVYVDEEEYEIDDYTASRLFSVFNRAWIGRPSRKETHDRGIFIDFGDGSTLFLAEATLKNRYFNFIEETPSFYAEYTNTRKQTYIFKNYRFPYAYLVKIVKGEE